MFVEWGKFVCSWLFRKEKFNNESPGLESPPSCLLLELVFFTLKLLFLGGADIHLMSSTLTLGFLIASMVPMPINYSSSFPTHLLHAASSFCIHLLKILLLIKISHTEVCSVMSDFCQPMTVRAHQAPLAWCFF